VRRGDQAVRIGAMSRRQADTLLAEQDAGLDTYLRTHYRTPAQQVEFVCRPR
jgi:phage gp36-like protein